MKNTKNTNRILITMFEMFAFCVILILGLFYGRQHPLIFLFGILTLFVAVLAIEVIPTKKDSILLAVGMIILAVAGTVVDKIITHFFFESNFLIRLIVECILLAPFYFPVFNHFCKMCSQMAKRLVKEDAAPQNNNIK